MTNFSKTEKRLTRNDKEDTLSSVYDDMVAYIKKNGTGFVIPQYDLYYTHINDFTICGDCDDDNNSINSNTSNENSTIHPGVCTNGVDDNCNGLIDCDDPSCTDFCSKRCSPSEDQCLSPPCCSNGFDDDCDFQTDCDDPDCFNDLSCSGNATLHGYVFDDQQYPIDIATVTGYPPFKPVVATFTDIFGFLILLGLGTFFLARLLGG